MHELGILTQVVAALERQLAADPRRAGGGLRVTAVGMVVGTLSGTSVEALHGAWPLASAGTIADGARLEVEVKEAAVDCGTCGLVEVADVFMLRCPRCGAPVGALAHGEETDVLWADVD